jgi:hypothetical protein
MGAVEQRSHDCGHRRIDGRARVVVQIDRVSDYLICHREAPVAKHGRIRFRLVMRYSAG